MPRESQARERFRILRPACFYYPNQLPKLFKPKPAKLDACSQIAPLSASPCLDRKHAVRHKIKLHCTAISEAFPTSDPGLAAYAAEQKAAAHYARKQSCSDNSRTAKGIDARTDNLKSAQCIKII
jgi:hypothetical protein